MDLLPYIHPAPVSLALGLTPNLYNQVLCSLGILESSLLGRGRPQVEDGAGWDLPDSRCNGACVGSGAAVVKQNSGVGPQFWLPSCIRSCFSNLSARKHLSTPGAY